MQLKVLFARKSHGHPDFKKEKNNNKVMSFSALFLMFTQTWITEKDLERVIENKRDEFRRKKNMEKDRKLKGLSTLIKISKCITSNYLGKRDCNIIEVWHVEVSSLSCILTWMVAHFIFGLQKDATVKSFHAEGNTVRKNGKYRNTASKIV